MKDKLFNKAWILPKWWSMIIWVMLAVPFSARSASAQERMTIITGKIQAGTVPDTLVFYYYRNFLYNNLGVEETVVHIDHNGYFQVKIADAALIGRITMAVKGSARAFAADHYLVQGDSVEINLVRRGKGLNFIFSGRGADKFIAKQRLDSVSALTVTNMRSIPHLSHQLGADPADKLSVTFNRLDYTASMQMEVLKQIAPKLPDEIYRLMRCDVNSYALERKYFNYWFAARRTQDKAVRERLLRKFYELELQGEPMEDAPVFRISRNYIELLARMAVVRDFVYGEQGLMQTYRFLKYGSPLAVRDRAVTSYLLSNPNTAKPGDYEQCILDASKSAKDALDKKMLAQLLTAYQKGSQLIDFELARVDGSIFKSTALKGQAVLIDFWFEGCTACITQTSEFNQRIMPKIKKDNKQVTVLSVNLDRNIAYWKRGLASGRYSIDGSIELFTGGSAFSHPIAKYYQIQACPRLLVFDQAGQLVFSDPDLKTLLSWIDGLPK